MESNTVMNHVTTESHSMTRWTRGRGQGQDRGRGRGRSQGQGHERPRSPTLDVASTRDMSGISPGVIFIPGSSVYVLWKNGLDNNKLLKKRQTDFMLCALFWVW